MGADLIVRDRERGAGFKPGVSTVEKAGFFASARAGAYASYWGRGLDDALALGKRWKPTLGGLIVVNDGDPEAGFATRGEAVEAARRFKFGAARFLASCDTHPKDGDVKQAPLVSGAVPKADAQTPSGDSNVRQ